MKLLRTIYVILVAIMLLLLALIARAEDLVLSPLIISEVKVRNGTDGYNEFIELYNATAEPLWLNDYTLQYYNVANPAATQTPTAEAVIDADILAVGEYLVLAKDATQIPLAKASPFGSLSDSAGRLRLLDDSGTIIDEVAWTSISAQSSPSVILVTSSAAAKSLTRAIDSAGSWTLSVPTPQSSVLTEPPLEAEVQVGVPADTNDSSGNDSSEEPGPNPVSPNDVAASALQITELLPNPASPVSDETGEFIELYNPGPEPIDLNGYKLQTGTNYSYSYIFGNQNLGSASYRAFYSSETKLVLANSTSKVRLLNPAGQVVSEITPYNEAKDNIAWALVDGNWQWTQKATPNAANILAAPLDAKKTKAAKAAAAKKPAKAKTASAKKTKTKTTKKVKTASAAFSQDDDQAGPLHPGILAGVGGSALLYGVYEYRHDAANTFRRLRRYRALRRALGPDT